MRTYIFIGLGSFFGAILRVFIRSVQLPYYYGKIPLNTLFINVGGSFMIALLFTIAYEIWEFNSDIRLGLTTGFLGAFTTFSTLCKEVAGLLQAGDYFSAIFYMAASLMLGLGAAYLGTMLARKLNPGKESKRKKK